MCYMPTAAILSVSVEVGPAPAEHRAAVATDRKQADENPAQPEFPPSM